MAEVEVQSPPEVLSPQSLLERSRSRDPYAFGELVKRNESDIKSIVKAIIQSPKKTEEVLQEAYCVAWAKIGQLKDVSKLVPWVVQIAVRIHYRMLRKKNRRKNLLERFFMVSPPPLEYTSKESDRPDYKAETDDMIDFVRKQLDDLPLDCRIAYTLYFNTGCSKEEVAETLNITVEAARKLIRKAEQLLAKKFRYSSLAVLAASTNIESPLPKVMDMILSGKLVSPAPEFLTATGVAASTSLKSSGGFVSSALTYLFAPFVWFMAFLVSCQLCATAVIRDAPTVQAKLWLIQRLFWGYCLVFCAPMLLLCGVGITEYYGGKNLAKWIGIAVGIPLLISYPAMLLSFSHEYNKNHQTPFRIPLIVPATVTKLIHYGFAATAFLATGMYVLYAWTRYNSMPSAHVFWTHTACGTFALGLHACSFYLFRHFLALSNDVSSQHAGHSVDSLTARSLLKEICYVLPAFAITAGADVTHFVMCFTTPHLLGKCYPHYAVVELVFFTGLWLSLALLNTVHPNKRGLKIVGTFFIAITIMVITRNLY